MQKEDNEIADKIIAKSQSERRVGGTVASLSVAGVGGVAARSGLVGFANVQHVEPTGGDNSGAVGVLRSAFTTSSDKRKGRGIPNDIPPRTNSTSTCIEVKQ